MGVTLSYGPDGSVFVSDWSDTGECHSVRNTRRHTGCIYRIAYGTPQDREVNLAQLSNRELVDLQTHRNDWFVRHARRLLQERVAAGDNMTAVREMLRALFDHSSTTPRKLRALWALHVTGGLSESTLLEQLDDEDEHIRTWTTQLLAEGRTRSTQTSPVVTSDLAQSSGLSTAALTRFRQLAASDPSPLVRVYLASALQRLPVDQRWPIAEALAVRAEDQTDANIPLMLWYGIEPLVHDDLARFTALASTAKMSLVRRHIARRVAALDPSDAGLVHLTPRLAESDDVAVQLDLLDGILHGLEGRRRVDMPDGWSNAYTRLYGSDNRHVIMRAIRLALIFDDRAASEQLSLLAIDRSVDSADRTIAIDALVAGKVDGFAPILLTLIDDGAVLSSVLRGLAEYDHPETADTILQHYESMPPTARQQAVQTLASRAAWATHLLTAMESDRIARSDVPAFTARQIRNLGDEQLTSRLNAVWGDVRATPKDRARLIARFKQRLTTAEL